MTNRKIKTNKSQEGNKISIEKQLERILRESEGEGDIPEGSRNFKTIESSGLNNNGCGENCIERDGFFLKYKEIYFFNKTYGPDGFDKNEVKQIAPQIEKICKKRSLRVRDEYALIRCDGQEFYVHIDDIDNIFLPELVGSAQDGTYRSKLYGKTDNPKNILMEPGSEIYNPKGRKSNRLEN